MKKKSAGSAALNSEIEGVNQAAAAAFTDTVGSARLGALPDGSREGGEGANSTTSCNTVLSNDNKTTFKALRLGVDSLYLSYHGQLDKEQDTKLEALKTLSQSDDEGKQALAQLTIGSHNFEVRDKGAPRFPYVLVDNCFFIKLNRKQSKTLPMAHVQISSEYLSAVGLEAAEADLHSVIKTLGLIEGIASVSRADLFLDFVSPDDLAKIEHYDWITRANLMAKYFNCRLSEPFTGWVIGIGGNLHARLYNKVIEIVTKSPHKAYLFDLWKANGWELGETVWRIEFQTQKQTLKELGIHSLPQLLSQQSALWYYLTHDWLRLSVPNLNDTKRDRWPNHALWDGVAEVYSLPPDQPRLQRFRPARLPADERLFVHGLGGVTSFMASRGIEDFWEGIEAYLSQAQDFHTNRGGSFYEYVDRKVKLKGKKFNTLKNQNNMKSAAEKLQDAIESYQRELQDKGEQNGDA
jgi:hypothetical protein